MEAPIRILHIVTHMNRGGLETMIMNYYRHIDRNKVQFDFLVHRKSYADYDAEIESLGGIIHRLPPLNPFSFKYRAALNHFFAAHKEYQIVHCHLDCMAGFPLKFAQKNGIPTRIAHSHSSNQDKNLKYPLKLYYKKKIPKYSTVQMACSDAAGKWMFGGYPFTVINNAIDTELYRYSVDTRNAVRNELGIDNNAKVVGHVGRFCPVKNHSFLLEVFAKIKEQLPSAVLLLVGDGELRANIESKIQTMGLSDSVIMTGVRSDVPHLLQAMDVFLFPSLYEGLGISVIEAQTAGLPCVVSHTVPPECMITNLVQKISLDETVAVWSQHILNTIFVPRLCTLEEIQKAGFDIQQNAINLQQLYLNIHSKG